MMNKSIYIIIAVFSAIALVCVIFCSIYFTVKVDVNKKIAEFLKADGALEYVNMTSGQTINIADTAAEDFIAEYLRDKKFTRTLLNADRIKGISSISKGNQYIVLHGKLLNINGKWYKTNADIAGDFYQKIADFAGLDK